MATVLLRPHNKTDGNCDHCGSSQGVIVLPDEPDAIIPAGYVGNCNWDDSGPYLYLGRCYYCNHRDRG